MEDQISQINQRLQATSEKVAQKVTKAIGAFYRSEKEKFAAAEIHPLTSGSTTSTIVVEPSLPAPTTTTFATPLQFDTATTFLTTTNICAPALNHNLRPGASMQNTHYAASIPCTQPSSIVSVLEPLVRIPAVTLTSPHTIRPPPCNIPMLSWLPQSEAPGNIGTTTPSYACSNHQNSSIHNMAYSPSTTTTTDLGYQLWSTQLQYAEHLCNSPIHFLQFHTSS